MAIGDEIIEQRKLTSKTMDNGSQDGRPRFISKHSSKILHVPADFTAFNAARDAGDIKSYTGGWDDLDSTIEPIANGNYGVRNAFYRARISPTEIGYRFESRRQGNVEVSLHSLDGQTNWTAPVPVVEDERITWNDVIPGLTIILVCRDTGVEFYKRIDTPAARVPITWNFREEDSSGIDLIGGEGKDNWSDNTTQGANKIPGRAGKPRRRLEINVTESQKTTTQGITRYRRTEEATGQVYDLNLTTGKFFLSNDIHYPLMIDAIHNETVAATTDDGVQTRLGVWDNTTWYIIGEGYFGAGDYRPAFWFDGVIVDKDATINSATLDLTYGGSSGGADILTLTADIAADDADDPVVMSTDDGPQDWTSTTARLSGLTVPTSGTVQHDIANIVEELTSRAGWASGQAMRFGFVDISTSDAYSYGTDYTDTGAIPELYIDWTASGGSILPQIMHHRTTQTG